MADQSTEAIAQMKVDHSGNSGDPPEGITARGVIQDGGVDGV